MLCIKAIKNPIILLTSKNRFLAKNRFSLNDIVVAMAPFNYLNKIKKGLFTVAPFTVLYLLIGCKNTPSQTEMEQWKAEVVAVEKEFNDMAQEKGLAEAFAYFAAEDGVIKRNRKIVQGKMAIREWYKKDVRPNESLTWKPTFVAVGNAGDLAYTYGDYVFTAIDSSGVKKESKGIFHTVWKRQTDGRWKFVWD